MNTGTGAKRVGSIAQRLKEMPYEKRVCRVEQYPPFVRGLEETYEGTPIEEYVDLIHEAGVEVHIVQSTFNRGTPLFASKMLPPHPNFDSYRLPRFLELAHEKGIIVLSYYAIMYNKPLKALHPEWMMEFIDFGYPAPEQLGWPCFNSPHRDWLGDYLIEIMDHLDLDGFYFDDTNWGSHEGRPFYPSCICKYCEDLFRKDTGLQIPRKVDFDNPDFRHFINWRYQKLLDFTAHVYRRVKEKYPDTIFDFHYYGRPTTSWVDGHQLNPLPFGEMGDHYFIETHRTVRETGFTAKVARSMGTPFCVWRNPIQSLPECIPNYAPYQEPHSPALHGLEGIINGGSSIFGSFGGPIHLHKNAMKAVFSELKKRVDYMDGKTVKYVALHYSQQSRDFRPSELPKNMAQVPYSDISQRNVNGIYEILNRSHLLLDIVLDAQLTLEHLSQYRVLFLTNSCLSAAQCEQIRQFVKAGGTLIATHETSLFDEFGQRRDNFELADVLGVDYQGSRNGGALQGVVYVPHAEGLADDSNHVICFAGSESLVSLRAGARALCTRSSLEGEQPLAHFDPHTDYDSGEPAVTLHSFGQGQAIYLSSEVGEGYLQNPYPPLKRFVARLVRKTQPPIEVEAPQAIEVTAARRAPNELMVHLLNNPTPMVPMEMTEHDSITNFFYLQELNPIHDIAVRFNDFKIKSARLPLQDLSLEIKNNPDTVVVPKVALHEVLIVELAD